MSGARWSLAVILFALLLPLAIGLSSWPFDDALIHLRVAENLASGEGPYFNPSDPVSASSSPLWSWLLALLVLVGGATPVVIATLNAALVALGAAFAAAAFFRPDTGKGGRLIECYWGGLYAALLLPAAGGLMELPAALALGFAALWAVREGHRWGWLLLGLSAGFRFEMLGFGLALIVIDMVRRRTLPSTPLTLWGLGCLPWLLYQLIAFGQPLSGTVGIKALVYQLSVVEAWRLVVAFFTPAWMTRGSSLGRPVWLLLLLLGGLGLLAWKLVKNLRTRDRDLLIAEPLGLAAVALALVYVGTGTLVFPWYAPLVMAPLALATLSVAQRSHRMLVLFCLLLWAPVAAELIPVGRAVYLNEPTAYRYFSVNARVGQYRAVGEALFDAYPDATLLSSEVGGLGYGFRGEILDAVGLTSSGIERYHPMPVPSQRQAGWVGAIPPELVRERSPELIVSLELFSESLRGSDLLRGYVERSVPIYRARERAAFAPQPVPTLWGGERLQIWIRRDLDPAAFDSAMGVE